MGKLRKWGNTLQEEYQLQIAIRNVLLSLPDSQIIRARNVGKKRLEYLKKFLARMNE